MCQMESLDTECQERQNACVQNQGSQLHDLVRNLQTIGFGLFFLLPEFAILLNNANNLKD